MSQVDALLAALDEQRRANDSLDREEIRQRAYNSKRTRGIIPLIGETIFDAIRKKQTAPEYESAIGGAMDAQSGVDALIAQMKQLEAQQAQADQDATRFETEGLYRQAGESRPNAALRARGLDVPDTPEATTLVQNLQAMGIDPRSPEGQRIMRENLTKGGVKVYTGSENFMPDSSPGAQPGAVVPRPGSDTEYDRARDAQQDKASRIAATETVGNKRYDAQVVVDTLDRVLEDTSAWTTGMGGFLTKNIPGSPALTVSGDLDTIMANLAFDRLTQMRNESKTGGALGQVSERELKLLQSAKASLNQAQNEGDFRDRVGIIKDGYTRFIDALNGKTPEGYESAEIGGKKYIKIDDEWHEL